MRVYSKFSLFLMENYAALLIATSCAPGRNRSPDAGVDEADGDHFASARCKRAQEQAPQRPPRCAPSIGPYTAEHRRDLAPSAQHAADLTGRSQKIRRQTLDSDGMILTDYGVDEIAHSMVVDKMAPIPGPGATAKRHHARRRRDDRPRECWRRLVCSGTEELGAGRMGAERLLHEMLFSPSLLLSQRERVRLRLGIAIFTIHPLCIRGLHLELCQRIRRRQHHKAGSVQEICRVIVIHAVEDEIVLFLALTVRAEVAGPRATRSDARSHSRGELCDKDPVPPVQRGVIDGLPRYRLTQRASCVCSNGGVLLTTTGADAARLQPDRRVQQLREVQVQML